MTTQSPPFLLTQKGQATDDTYAIPCQAPSERF